MDQSVNNWLKKPSIRSTVWSSHFFHFSMAFAFTLFAIFVDSVLAANWKFVGSFGIAIFSGYFGWAVGELIKSINEGGKNFQHAKSLVSDAHEEIQRISENWSQVSHSLQSLEIVGNDRVDFVKASRFYIGNHLITVRGRIERMANEIKKLGFNSSAFLSEVKQEFNNTRKNALSLVRSSHKKEDSEPIEQIFESLVFIQDQSEQSTPQDT